MSWMFKRGNIWKYLQFAQHRRMGNVFSSPNMSFNPEPEELLSMDDTSSASQDEDIDSAVLYGSLRGNVVGLRYYTGVVNNHEMVALQREPTNPYDRNAVKVNNVNGEQVGHIKKELAAALAYIMDNKLAKVEGVVPYGANNAFNMPVQLSFWGKEENKQVVLDHLKRHGFKLGPEPYDVLLQRSTGGWAERGSNAWQHGGGRRANKRGRGSRFSFELSWDSERAGPSYDAPVLPAVQMTTEQLKTEFDKLFEDLREDDKTREMEPAEAVGTPLLSHQKQALAWMVFRENSKDLPPFWEQRNNLYYNTLTNFAENERPINVLGGILADDMGLGKTLSTIALILTNFHDGEPFPVKITEVEEMPKKVTNMDKPLKSEEAMKPDKAMKLEDHCNKHLSELSELTVGSQNVNFEVDSKKNSEMVRQHTFPGRPKRLKAKKAKYTFSSDSEPEDSKPKKTKDGISLLQGTFFGENLAGPSAKVKKSSKNKEKSGPAGVLKTVSGERPRTTLIICPLSVLSNWMEQFESHVRPDVHLNVLVYYGADRSKDPRVLSMKDVVLTTYSVLNFDYGNGSESPLHKIKWLRVVLDEGHTIRNPNAQQTKAALDLVAERRWVLTGTPIQNSLKDLWSLISFFKLKPFIDREWWHRTIQRPVTMGDAGGLNRLQSLIKTITLRRTKTSKVKGKAVLELPERKVFVQKVTLSDEERQIYDSVKTEGRASIGRYFNEGTVLTHYADVLALLVRLRQLCCHPHLVSNASTSSVFAGCHPPVSIGAEINVPARLLNTKVIPILHCICRDIQYPAEKENITRLDSNLYFSGIKDSGFPRLEQVLNSLLKVGAKTGDSTPEELRERLMAKMKLVLSSGSDEECAICLDSLNFPVITHCAHVFCRPCICEVIHNEQPNAKCPLCRNSLCLENLVECPPETLDSTAAEKTDREWMSSSKVDALMYALIHTRKKDPTIKSIIVSQFTSFLTLIETPLRESGFVFTRLDGSMTQKKRVEAIRCFQSKEPESPTLMLLSMKAGGVGLNLTAASRVYLMDPAWNPAAEEQCFDRCHRLGQKKEVIITKFIVMNSVEENMMQIQDKKRELAAGAFGTKKPNASERKQARIDEIKTLIDI